MPLSTQVKWNHVHVPSLQGKAETEIAQGRAHNLKLAEVLRSGAATIDKEGFGEGCGCEGGRMAAEVKESQKKRWTARKMEWNKDKLSRAGHGPVWQLVERPACLSR